MSTMTPQTGVLPLLRPDIELRRGPDESDGSPTYIIHDPLQGTFEKATWVQARILRLLRVPQTVDRILQYLRRCTTIRVTPQDIRQLCADASRRGLTRDACVARTPHDHAQATGAGAWDRMLWRLLYLRIPLVSPDDFLARTLPLIRPLGHPAALMLYGCIGVLGGFFLMQRFDAYVATFPYFFSPGGAVGFTLTIIAVKIIHELSHAYVAKGLGNRVATMGVCLILLFPVAYCDVTDSWRMRSRRKRLLIGLAGVAAELAIAGAALVAWTISPPGLLKSLCFVLSSTTLLATLLVNLNPLMRFDGYYVLSDLAGIDNLQSRSFALTRWCIRRHVFGLKVSPPETVPTRHRLTFMVAYALLAWLYRLFLYAGIALALYCRLTKVVGGALFLFALYALIARPLAREFAAVLALRRSLGWNPRLAMTAAACALGLSWAALPLPRWKTAPATTVACESQIIYTRGGGVLGDLRVGPGSEVHKGDTLFIVASEQLDARLALARLEVRRVGIELAVARSDESQRELLRQKTEELARAKAALETALAAIEANRITAAVDGVIAEWDESVREGMPVASDQVIGRIVSRQAPRVVCYLAGDLATHLSPGDGLRFVPGDGIGPLTATVRNVDPLRTTHLEHRNIASASGGDIAVMPDTRGRLSVNDSLYEVELELDAVYPSLRVGQRGRVWVRTAPRSHAVDLATYLARVLVRESSF